MLGTLGGLVVVLGSGWTGYLAARRLLPGASASLRLTGAGVAACGVLYAALHLLLALHAFVLPVGLAALAASAAAAHRLLDGRGGLTSFRDDAGRAASVISGLVRGPGALLAAVVAAVLGARLVRGLVLPPMGWDAVVYHLFKAGRWVHEGASAFQPAPDGWGYYEYFPSGGSAFWAWALLPARDGMLLAPAAALVVAGVLVAVYALARRLGAGEGSAAAAAGLVAITPAFAAELTVSYVDNTALAFFVAGMVLAVGSGAAGELFLLGTALGLAAATKASLLPAAVLGIALAAIRAARIPSTSRRRAWAWTACLLPIAACVAVEYGRAVRDHGNPLYPFALIVAGHTILPGQTALMDILAGRDAAHDLSSYTWLEPFRWLFTPLRWPRSDYAGYGPAAPLILGAAMGGLVLAVRDRRVRIGTLFMAVCAAAILAGAFGRDTLALRTIWASVFSRHLTPVWALAVVFASVVPIRSAWPAWTVAVASAAWLGWPRGWASADLGAVERILPAIAAGGAIAALAAWLPWLDGLGRGSRAVLAAAALLIPTAAVLPGVREAARYPIWASTLRSTEGAFDFHFMDDDATVAWPIWQRLDREPGAVVAAICGWNGVGQSWYLYPLLGSRLQHEVVYVPPTRDGTVVDYADPERLARVADFRAWLRRLVDRRVDFIVTLTPSTFERTEWMTAHPDVFVAEMGDDDTDNFLYRFDRRSAARLLESR